MGIMKLTYDNVDNGHISRLYKLQYPSRSQTILMQPYAKDAHKDPMTYIAPKDHKRDQWAVFSVHQKPDVPEYVFEKDELPVYNSPLDKTLTFFNVPYKSKGNFKKNMDIYVSDTDQGSFVVGYDNSYHITGIFYDTQTDDYKKAFLYN